jgi:4-hydroxy-tetrahydrodipicolinate reductase
MPLKLAIAGAGGRMGRMLIEAAGTEPAVIVSAALEHAASPLIGQAALPGVPIGADIDAALSASDVLIDFTRPEGTMAHLAACRRLGRKIIIGTTGFTPEQKAEIAAAANEIAVVFAPSMSMGVNVTMKLVEMAARTLGMDCDIEVHEAHHKMKVDAPSGTALKLGEIAAAARGQSLDEAGIYARHGVTGERKPGSIGFSVVRAGDIVGDHTVMFAGTGERIEITHRSSSRATYAQGAMRAARFLAGRKTGLYDMQDVLGLK